MRPSHLYNGNPYAVRQQLYVETGPRPPASRVTVLTSTGNLYFIRRLMILKTFFSSGDIIRNGYFVFVIGIPIHRKDDLFIETGPCCYRQYVVITSESAFGVPQGSVLGPILFTCHNNSECNAKQIWSIEFSNFCWWHTDVHCLHIHNTE